MGGQANRWNVVVLVLHDFLPKVEKRGYCFVPWSRYYLPLCLQVEVGPRSVNIKSLFSWGWWGGSVHAGQHAHWRGAGSSHRGQLLTLFYTIYWLVNPECAILYLLVGQPWVCDFVFTGRSTLNVQFCIYSSVNPEWVCGFVFTAWSTLRVRFCIFWSVNLSVRFCIYWSVNPECAILYYWSVNTDCAILYLLVGQPWVCDFVFTGRSTLSVRFCIY